MYQPIYLHLVNRILVGPNFQPSPFYLCHQKQLPQEYRVSLHQELYQLQYPLECFTVTENTYKNMEDHFNKSQPKPNIIFIYEDSHTHLYCPHFKIYVPQK